MGLRARCIWPSPVAPFATGFCRPAGRMNASAADRAGAWLQETDRLETARDRGEPPHHRLCGHDAGPDPEGRRHRRDPDRADGHCAAPHRARRAVRGRRVLHADLLRFLRAAHHRQEPRPLPDRGDVELHQLHHRPQYRRHRLHRRRDPVPDLFRLRPDRDRCRQDLLSLRPDLLARQPVRARLRHGLASLGGVGDGPAAAVDEPADRDRLPCRHRGLFRLAADRARNAANSARTAGRWYCPRPG